MKNKNAKKEHIRQLIIIAAGNYRDKLAGKTFLYIYGNECMEIIFKTDRFKHLTGVDSNLGANVFYKLSKNAKITTNQFGFTKRHPYETAKKKLPCLVNLSDLTDKLVCIVEDFNTVTITYKLGVTNLDFTIGLVADSNNPCFYVPQTLRIKDSPIESSLNAEFVDFILSKSSTETKYNEVHFCAEDLQFPEKYVDKLSSKLKKHFVSLGVLSNTVDFTTPNQSFTEMLDEAINRSDTTIRDEISSKEYIEK